MHYPRYTPEDIWEGELDLSPRSTLELPAGVVDKMIELLRRHPDGLRGSQFPEAYRRNFGDTLSLENVNREQLTLSKVLTGHPSVRKDASSGYNKWFYLDSSAPVSGGPTPSMTTGPTGGIEDDVVSADMFPMAAWLRDYNMDMYQWAGNPKEWTEFALRLLPEVSHLFEMPGECSLENLRHASGCQVSIGVEKLRGKDEKFLVFVRGDSGSPANSAMALALDIVCRQLREYFMRFGSSIHPSSLRADPSGNFSGIPGGMGGAIVGGLVGDTQYPISNPNHVYRVVDVPQAAVGLVAGRGGRRLETMRRKSGAEMNLASKNKGHAPAKLTIYGSQASVDIALQLVEESIAESEA